MNEVIGARPFHPPRWAKGPHAQTILARSLRPAGQIPVERERLDTPDGDFIDVDWGPEPMPGAPVALVLHGLEGSSSRRYVRSVCQELTTRGVFCVAMNFRGCSGEPNRADRFYHSGETSDAAWLIDLVRTRLPGRRYGAVGFSLGGNVLLKMLGERSDGGRGILDAAVAMSVPYDLAAGSALLERSVMGRAYSAYFMRSLRSKVAMKKERLATVIDLDFAGRARTIREFDDRVTAPLNGFESGAAYYHDSSSMRYLEGVQVSTLLLHALDDPFLPAESIPVSTARDNPAVTLSLQGRGGHVGFVEGSPWRPRFWGEESAAAFLAAALARP